MITLSLFYSVDDSYKKHAVGFLNGGNLIILRTNGLPAKYFHRCDGHEKTPEQLDNHFQTRRVVCLNLTSEGDLEKWTDYIAQNARNTIKECACNLKNRAEVFPPLADFQDLRLQKASL